MMQITELEVWKAAIELSKRVYFLTGKFPESENFGLSYQLRRTVVHIPSHIAAAASRKYGRESLRSLFKAKDYIYDVESQLFLAQRLGYMTEEELRESVEYIDTSKKLLFGFIKFYKRSANKRPLKNDYRKNDYADNNYDDDDNKDNYRSGGYGESSNYNEGGKKTKENKDFSVDDILGDLDSEETHDDFNDDSF